MKKILGELGEMEEIANDFLSSLEDDEALFEPDILVGEAHVLMLIKEDIVSKETGKKILESLEKINYSDIKGEDVHVAIESELRKKIGKEKAGWLHTARSRNDEVATCIRIRVRDELIKIAKETIKLIETLIKKSKKHKKDFLPGFTHLQHAEPTTISHHLLSYSQSILRDLDRIIKVYKRTNRSPLGAGALTTTSYDINRKKTASLLGFDEVIKNSIDAVDSRDYLVETSSVLLNEMLTISKLAEELILWSSKEFSFIELPDKYTSTSSIMPQKKNPDILEMIRAKTSIIQGNLVSVSGIIKANPRAYNRDLQEINPKIWESIEITQKSIHLIQKILKKTTYNLGEINDSLQEDQSNASELANKLVRKNNIPFRLAHNKIASQIKEGKTIKEIAKNYGIPETEINKKEILKKKKNIGSPAPNQVEKNIQEQLDTLDKKIQMINKIENRVQKKLNKLDKEINELLD